MTSHDIKIALELSPAFYEATLDPDRWPTVLNRLRKEFDADVGQLTYANLSVPEVIMSYQSGLTKEQFDRWLAFDDHEHGDPRNRLAFRSPNKPTHCRLLVSEEEFHASSIYRNVLKQIGLEYTMGVIIPFEDQNWGVVLSLLRKAGTPGFSDEDLERLHLYLPHLRQSALVAGKMHMQQAFSDVFTKAFDELRLATMILNGNKVLQYANPAAQALLQSGTALWVSQGRVVPADHSVAPKFSSLVFRGTSSEPCNARKETSHLVIPRTDGGPSLYASITPVANSPKLAGLPLQSNFYCVVFVNDPSARYETTAEHLQRLYGLTNTEAEIMQHYGHGKNVREISELGNRSQETVRTHLKAVRDKSSARSQADIVRIVTNLSS